MTKFRILAFAVLAFLASTNSRAQEDGARQDSGAFTKRQVLLCSAANVEVITSCVEPRETAFCSSQKVIFGGAPNAKVIEYTHHRPRYADQSFIASASCTEIDGKPYIVLGSTNFGNCDDCEWVDVYTIDGRYIGSTKGMTIDSKVPFLALPTQLSDALFGSNRAHISNRMEIDISRVNDGS